MTPAVMHGKRVVVTGATNGIGRVTATELGKLGADVVLVARDAKKAEATLAELARAGGRGEAVIGDLSLMSDVRRIAAEIARGRVDVLVNNAGAIYNDRQLTAEGFERTFALNHLSYFLLTHLLLDRLKAAGAGRVVNLSSGAHRGGKVDFAALQPEPFSSLRVYCGTKLMNLLFTFELARRLDGSGVTANAAHPGFVASGFGNDRGFTRVLFQVLSRPFQISPARGARTSIWLASEPALAGVSGKYFIRKKARAASRRARDLEAQRRLWLETEKLLGL